MSNATLISASCVESWINCRMRLKRENESHESRLRRLTRVFRCLLSGWSITCRRKTRRGFSRLECYWTSYGWCNIRAIDSDSRLTFYRSDCDRIDRENIRRETPSRRCETERRAREFPLQPRHADVAESIPANEELRSIDLYGSHCLTFRIALNRSQRKLYQSPCSRSWSNLSMMFVIR